MKKILALLLTLLLVLSVVGCDDKEKDDKIEENKNEAIEMFEGMISNMPELDNMSMTSTLSLELEQLEMMGIPSPLLIELSGDVSSHKNMKMNIAVDLGIMPIELDLFVTEDQLLLHSELIGSLLGASYMSLNLEEVLSQVETSTEDEGQLEQIKDIIKRYEASSEYSLYDIFVFDEKVSKEKVMVNEENIEASKITMNLSLDKAVDFLYDFMTFAADDEEARSLLLTSMTDEEIDEMKAEMLDPENRQEIETALEGVTINTFQVNFYLNKDLAPVKMDFDIDVSVENEGEIYEVKVKMDQEMFNFGKVEEIQMPDVDPSEIQDLFDFLPSF